MCSLEEKSELLARKACYVLKNTLPEGRMNDAEYEAILNVSEDIFLARLKEFEKQDKSALLEEALMISIGEKAEKLSQTVWDVLLLPYRKKFADLKEKIIMKLKMELFNTLYYEIEKLPEDEPGIAY